MTAQKLPCAKVLSHVMLARECVVCDIGKPDAVGWGKKLLSPETQAVLASLLPISSTETARARLNGDFRTAEGAAAAGIPSEERLDAMPGVEKFIVWIELQLDACGWTLLSPEASPEEKANAHKTRARLLSTFRSGDPEAVELAVRDCCAALEALPDDQECLLERARLYRYKKELALALADHDALVRLASDNHQYAQLRARVLLAMGRFALAEPEFTRAIELASHLPPMARAFYFSARAEVLQHLGKQKLMVADLKMAVRLYPDWATGRERLDEARRGQRVTF